MIAVKNNKSQIISSDVILKNELGMPNDITNQAEEIFNVIAEENVE